MSLEEFIELLPSRRKRSIQRMLNAGPDDERLKLYKDIKQSIENGINKPIKTHCRDFVIFPGMIGMTIKVYNGKEFVEIVIKDAMVGHILGEFALTRHMVTHSAPGIGATRSTKFVSVK